MFSAFQFLGYFGGYSELPGVLSILSDPSFNARQVMWFFFPQAVCEHLMSCDILYWPFCCSWPLCAWPGHVIQPERRLSVSTTSAHTLNKARRCCKPVVFRAHSHLPTSMFDLWITEAFLWLFVNPFFMQKSHTTHTYTQKTKGYCTSEHRL